ncbi:MAG: DUF805 domain-containing protein [Sphingomonadales bacterium]|nr:DUF805 domain-containing protein [Sphingomonadales bacterium]MBU3991784.1 DUF805 domain-containing protein [Alphaproteobacteria bacterium]
MTFGESITTCLTKFVTWQGRASRSEFWYFWLFSILCYLGAMVIDQILGTTFDFIDPETGIERSIGYGFAYILVALGLFLPGLSAMVRRLHDTDRSGWWYWIILVPLIGAIVLLVWLCSRGTAGTNRFGFDPLNGDISLTFN